MTKRPTAIIILVLVILTFAAYWRVLGNGFVEYDDDQYVYANKHIQQGITAESLRWAFNVGYASNWHPLTWISHMVDWRLFGDKPMGHHLVSLLLHILNTVLLFLVIRRMTSRPGSTQAGSLWKSAFVAALFAVHPLHVESVAWISERKDVLSTFFWLLTMGAYVLYSEKPGVKRYLPVFFLYALGLMAKPMLVTLPLVLLLLDYWPIRTKRPWTRLVLEKTPLLALSAFSCAITFIAQARGESIASSYVYPPGIRIANALVGYVTYLWKMLWPNKLAVIYPHPYVLPLWKTMFAAVLLICISLVVLKARRRHPYLLTGWAWYLIALVPVVGFVQVGWQAVANRYTYVPLIGLFVMIAWGVPEILRLRERQGERTRIAVITAACLIILVLATGTWVQVGYWRDSTVLFEHALACTRNNFLAHDALGAALLSEERYAEAEAQERAALKVFPEFAQGYYNLGTMLQRQGKYYEAIKAYQQALTLDPHFGMAHNNLAVALGCVGDYEEAWKEVHLAENCGTAVASGFKQALAENMPDPGE